LNNQFKVFKLILWLRM